MRKKIRLGVNIDHVATLRQVRGGITSYPNLIQAAEDCYHGGADLITVHLREDRRHIQDKDVESLCRWGKLPINLELAVREDMVNQALKFKPQWVCFVPEKRKELTTEGGLDLRVNQKKIRSFISLLQQKKIQVSLFIAPRLNQIQLAADLGANAIELHTGHWVNLRGKALAKEWNQILESANFAKHLGLGVHAGHGLDYEKALELKKIQHIEELNIGHFLVCESLRVGLKKSVSQMVKLLRNG